MNKIFEEQVVQSITKLTAAQFATLYADIWKEKVTSLKDADLLYMFFEMKIKANGMEVIVPFIYNVMTVEIYNLPVVLQSPYMEQITKYQTAYIYNVFAQIVCMQNNITCSSFKPVSEFPFKHYN